ncbi:hypothetical protein J6590_084789 [Homalodisca vitripennis]|nr:hypothetical protein J6590_084789 [Homalodisca vitripennis]
MPHSLTRTRSSWSLTKNSEKIVSRAAHISPRNKERDTPRPFSVRRHSTHLSCLRTRDAGARGKFCAVIGLSKSMPRNRVYYPIHGITESHCTSAFTA